MLTQGWSRHNLWASSALFPSQSHWQESSIPLPIINAGLPLLYNKSGLFFHISALGSPLGSLLITLVTCKLSTVTKSYCVLWLLSRLLRIRAKVLKMPCKTPYELPLQTPHCLLSSQPIVFSLFYSVLIIPIPWVPSTLPLQHLCTCWALSSNFCSLAMQTFSLIFFRLLLFCFPWNGTNRKGWWIRCVGSEGHQWLCGQGHSSFHIFSSYEQST